VTTRIPLPDLQRDTPFVDRHIGPRAAELDAMLAAIGASSLDELASSAVPDSIRDDATPDGHPASTLPPAASESEVLAELRALAARNTVTVPMIGLGYSGTVTPPVIRRNVLENPAWYTAYTPYQPEISQGRLEALLTFQTTVADLTGLPVAGASLLDEASAAAEAMTLLRRAGRAAGARFVVDADTLPQTLEVLRTRAAPIGIELVVADLSDGLPDGDCFGVLLSYPGASGAVRTCGR
jgi:glycine dehydrogenase